MKLFFTLPLAIMISTMQVSAAVVDIDVINFQFSPANANVAVGDVVRFHFKEGFHDAISQDAVIPTGAAAIFSGNPSNVVRDYDYTVSVAGQYHYYCSVHGDAQGNGMVGTFTASEVLPVTFSSFAITTTEGQQPVLTWKTFSEQDAAYFSVRASTDATAFVEIGRVEARGNSNQAIDYSFTDMHVPAGYRFIYYEIVSIDGNSRETYSPIKMYKASGVAQKLILKLAPNPIQKPAQLMIQFNAEQPGRVEVQVFNMSGQRVMQTSLGALQGLNNAHVHVCDLPAGMYNLQFQYEGMLEQKKIIVQ